MKLDIETRIMFSNLLNGALVTGTIPRPCESDRRNFRQRALRALKRNLQEPGDCKGDLPLLCGLAIAQAYIGIGPSWIPEVQRIGCSIASLVSR